MYNRDNTLGFAALLDVTVIDLATELEILVDQAPTPRDHFAVLSAARTLVNYGVAIEGVQVTDDYMEVREYFEVKGNIGLSFEVIMHFNEDLALLTSEVHVKGMTAAKAGGDQFSRWGSVEKKCLVFENVDLSQFIATPKLLGPLAGEVFMTMFNSPYSDDFVQMAELALDDSQKRHLIFIEGQHYGVIGDRQNHCFYPRRGFHDLIELAAMIFLRDQPQHGDVRFAAEPRSSKGTELFLAVEAVE